MLHPISPFGGGVGPRPIPLDFVGPWVTYLNERVPIHFPYLNENTIMSGEMKIEKQVAFEAYLEKRVSMSLHDAA